MNDNPIKKESTIPGSMRESVLSQITSRKVEVRPRWKFVLTAVLAAVGAVLAALAALYFASFIVFSLRQSGSLLITGFGASGWGEFFRTLPWVLIALAVLFIILLSLLVRRYEFVYGRPMFISAVVVIVLVALSGAAIGYSSLHARIGQQGGVAAAHTMYRHYGAPPANFFAGTITATTASGFTMSDPHYNDVLRVVVAPQTQLPPNGYQQGDPVAILGKRDRVDHNLIHADSIREIGHAPQFPMRPDADDSGTTKGLMIPVNQ